MYKYLLLFLFVNTSAFCQVYEKGYYIDNDNNRIECFIKNKDKLVTPKTIVYKLNEESQPIEASITNVKEYAVAKLKYVRATVDVDQSSNDLHELSKSQYPEWRSETLFLKVLVEGKANLYYARHNKDDRFFFNTDSGSVKQLVHKLFTVSTTQSGSNNDFQYQLQKEVNCKKVPEYALKKLRYNEYLLTKFFKDHNECSGVTYAKNSEKKKNSMIHLKITPGADFASATLTNGEGKEVMNFGQKTSMRLGAEFEYVLPVNRNKWSIILEPTYQSFKGKSQTKYTAGEVTNTTIEIPVGVRYHFILTKQASIFLNAQCVLDLPIDCKVALPGWTYKSPYFRANGAAGVGFKYQRFSIEGRYYSRRNIFLYQSGYDGTLNYYKTSIIAGFRIF
ncbi:MAG: hypothetical protein ABIS36_04770 [Chryseolinea sp.]